MPALLLAALVLAADPPVVPLWEAGPPGFEARKGEREVRDRQSKSGEYRVTNVHQPYLTAFLPPADKATGVGVVICPGGGHRELWVMHEGEFVAQWLADRGVAAFVLRYRLGREKDSPYRIDEHARQDGVRALRLVRSRAAEWKLDPAKVGVMGFSAGGETVGLVVGAAAGPQPDAADPADRPGAVPAFQAHVYSGPLGVRGATVTKDTPPAFLLVGDQDGAAAWLVEHFQALRAAKVPAELHVYAKAPHGFGYRPGAKTNRPVDQWPQRFLDWLGTMGFLK
jgi:acetyl esterase/lipase